MSNVFRIALEGEPQRRPIKVKGPLGQEITNALNKEYAKVDLLTGDEAATPATESQAMDESVLGQLVDAVTNSPDNSISDGVQIYALGEDGPEPEDVVNVASDLADEATNHQYVVIADASAPSNEDGTGNADDVTIDITEEEVPSLESDLKSGVLHFGLGYAKTETLKRSVVRAALESTDVNVAKLAFIALKKGSLALEEDDEDNKGGDDTGTSKEPNGESQTDSDTSNDSDEDDTPLAPEVAEWDKKFEDLASEAEKAGVDVEYKLEAEPGEGGTEAEGESAAAGTDNGNGEAATEAHTEKGKHSKKFKFKVTRTKDGKKKKSKAAKKAALETLRVMTEAMGGKFFYSMEDYVNSLPTPVNPEQAQDPINPEQPGICDPQNPGADGTGEAGNTNHVSQQDGGVQPGTGQNE